MPPKFLVNRLELSSELFFLLFCGLLSKCGSDTKLETSVLLKPPYKGMATEICSLKTHMVLYENCELILSKIKQPAMPSGEMTLGCRFHRMRLL